MAVVLRKLIQGLTIVVTISWSSVQPAKPIQMSIQHLVWVLQPVLCSWLPQQNLLMLAGPILASQVHTLIRLLETDIIHGSLF